MARKVAYVADKDAVREKYTRAIQNAGFHVDAYTSAQDALSVLQKELPDLALLDITQVDDRDPGYRLCTEIRHMSDVIPIILLSNRQCELDNACGIRAGADDYINYETSVDYLLVRIESLLRRIETLREAYDKPAETSHDTHKKSDLELNEEYFTVRWKGKLIDMPLKHFWMLWALSHNSGNALSLHDLMDTAGLTVEPNTIAANIKAIRRAFLREDASFHCIRTERGRGYRWVED